MTGCVKSTVPLPLQAEQNSCLLCTVPCLLPAPSRGRFGTHASLLALLWRVITVLASRGFSVIPGQGAAPASQKSSAAQISGEEQGGKQCSAPSVAWPQQRMLKGLAASWAAVPIALQGTGRVAAALSEGTRCLFPS